MFNASLKLETDRNLWLRDDSSLSSDSSDDNKLNAKRFRRGHQQTMAQLAHEASMGNAMRLPNGGRLPSGNPTCGHTEYHHREDISLVNSTKTGDGLETDFYREKKLSHAGRPFSDPSHMNGQGITQVMHQQMQMMNNNKRQFEYGVPKNTHKKQKNKNISYRIQNIFNKISTDDAKAEFVQHLLENVSQHMARDDYKSMLMQHINSQSDVEKQMDCCKEMQKLISMKVTEIQSEIAKKKSESTLSDELKAYMDKVPNFTEHLHRFMIAEGVTTVQNLIWVTDDCWEDFLTKSNKYKVKSRDIHLLRTISSWMRNNELRESNKILPEHFDMSYLGCFQRHPRK